MGAICLQRKISHRNFFIFNCARDGVLNKIAAEKAWQEAAAARQRAIQSPSQENLERFEHAKQKFARILAALSRGDSVQGMLLTGVDHVVQEARSDGRT